MSPFAAGCAICGAELDPHRDRRGRGSLGLRLPALPPVAGDVAIAVILVLLALLAPPLGLLISILVGVDRHRQGDTPLRNVAVVAAGLALLSLLFPFWLWAQILGRG